MQVLTANMELVRYSNVHKLLLTAKAPSTATDVKRFEGSNKYTFFQIILDQEVLITIYFTINRFERYLQSVFLNATSMRTSKTMQVAIFEMIKNGCFYSIKSKIRCSFYVIKVYWGLFLIIWKILWFHCLLSCF